DEVDSIKLTILDAQSNELRAYTNKRDKSAPSAAPDATSSTESESSEISGSAAQAAASREGEVQQVTAEEEVSQEEIAEEAGPWAPNQAGMNRFVSDYRLEKPVKLESGSRGAREEALENVGGPRALPGDYQVQLTVGSETFTHA